MRIRLANAADLPDIAAIYNHEIRSGVATFDTEPWDAHQAQAWFDKHNPETRPITVAVDDDDVVVGWGSLSDWSTRCAYQRAAEDSVYVKPDQQGNGIGKRLLTDLIERAESIGVGVLLARIETNCAVSLHVHRSLGFTTAGVLHRVGEKFGRILDVEIMERPVGSSE